MHKQKGFTFWSFVFTVVPIILVALLVMLLFPSYAEYFTIKKAIAKIGSTPSLSSMTDGDIRDMMQKTMEIDQISSIKPSDLVIRRSDAGVTVSVEYEAVVPLFANISALMAFSATTDKGTAAAAAAAN